MARDKTIYEETYKAPGLKLTPASMPKLNHLAPGYLLKESYLLKAGEVERNGKRLSFHVIKLYIEEGT